MNHASPPKRSANSMVRVHARLRAAILDGKFEQGAVLPQVTLAQQFGVSRTPLREALRMLQAEGLVDSVPNHRVRVARFSVEDLHQLYMMRIPLESLALRVSVPRFKDIDLARLRRHLEAMRREAAANRVSGWNAQHRAFHCALAAPAGERVQTMVGQLLDGADRYRRLLLKLAQEEVWQRADAQHDEIVVACERRDSIAASILLGRHLAQTAIRLGELMGSDVESVPVRLALAAVESRAAG